MAFPKVSDWSEKVYNAGSRGFNLLVDFEREMHRVYPDTQPYTFGYYMESDVPERSTLGWKHLKGSMFDVEDWNSTVGLRFGLTVDASDNIMYGSNFVMLMPKSYREEVILPERLDAIKRLESAADEDSVVVHPEDPEYNKMKDAGRAIAKTEKTKVQITGTPNRGEEKADSW